MLEEFNLHTIVRLPKGVFSPYTDINTNLLFLEKGKSTKEIWYFEHPLPEGYKNYTKTRPIKIEEFELEKQWWNNREENEYAWKVSIEEIKSRNYNLDIKNPNKQTEEFVHSTEELIDRIDMNLEKSKNLLQELKGVLNNG